MIDLRPICSLLICSCEGYVEEAALSASRIRELGLLDHFEGFTLLGRGERSLAGFTQLALKWPGTWSSDVRQAVEQLVTPYVLLWIDDLVPVRVLDLDGILKRVHWLAAAGGHYLRLVPFPSGTGPEVFPGIREIPRGSLYRTSTVLSVWRRETLLAILNDAESAWQLELDGSRRSDAFPGFYACDRPHLEYVNLVVKGLVDPVAADRLAAHGVTVPDLGKPIMTSAQVLRRQLVVLRWRALQLVPASLRRGLRMAFNTNPSLKK